MKTSKTKKLYEILDLIESDLKEFVIDDEPFFDHWNQNRKNKYEIALENENTNTEKKQKKYINKLTKATPWTIFFVEQHSKNANTDLNQREMRIEIAAKWNSLSSDEKEIYKNRAEIETKCRLQKWRDQMLLKSNFDFTGIVEKKEIKNFSKDEMRNLIIQLDFSSNFDAYTSKKVLKDMILELLLSKNKKSSSVNVDLKPQLKKISENDDVIKIEQEVERGTELGTELGTEIGTEIGTERGNSETQTQIIDNKVSLEIIEKDIVIEDIDNIEDTEDIEDIEDIDNIEDIEKTKLTIGQLIEVFNTKYEKWFNAIVVKTDKTQILVHYNGWNKKTDEWVNENTVCVWNGSKPSKSDKIGRDTNSYGITNPAVQTTPKKKHKKQHPPKISKRKRNENIEDITTKPPKLPSLMI